MATLAKKIGPILCAGLALSAVEAMASTDSSWELEALTQATQADPSTPAGRLGAIGDYVVGSQKASQSMAHSWYRLLAPLERPPEPLPALPPPLTLVLIS